MPDTKDMLSELKLSALRILQEGKTIPPEIKEQLQKTADQFDDAAKQNSTYNMQLHVSTLNELLLNVKDLKSSDKTQLLDYMNKLSGVLDATYSELRQNVQQVKEHLQAPSQYKP